MGGHEPVTLAIDASRLPDDNAERLIRGLVERCGLDQRDDVALAAVIGAQDPGQRKRMLNAAHAVYHQAEDKDSHLPAFTPASLDRLREAARAWQRQ
jgi:hypothetical protein